MNQDKTATATHLCFPERRFWATFPDRPESVVSIGSVLVQDGWRQRKNPGNGGEVMIAAGA